MVAGVEKQSHCLNANGVSLRSYEKKKAQKKESDKQTQEKIKIKGLV